MGYSLKVMDKRLTDALKGQILRIPQFNVHYGQSEDEQTYEVNKAYFAYSYNLVCIDCFPFEPNGKINKDRAVRLYVGIEEDTVEAISLNYTPLYFKINLVPNGVSIYIKEKNLGEEFLDNV